MPLPNTANIFLAMKYFKSRNMVHEKNQLLKAMRHILPQKDGSSKGQVLSTWTPHKTEVIRPPPTLNLSDYARENRMKPAE